MPVLAGLMVSRIPYVHVGTLLARRRTFSTLVLLVFLTAFVILFVEIMLPALCVGFMLSGPVIWLFRRGRTPTEDAAEDAAEDDAEDDAEDVPGSAATG